MRLLCSVRYLLVIAAILFFASPGYAQTERIVDYRSDITLEDDASLLVQETITVIAAGQQIRHGIYREFPTTYVDHLGNRYVVGFQMLSATRDSASEPFRLEYRSNGKRIYLGDSNALVSPGRHTYTLTYSTNRQLGFFADHDELFWNVTGSDWNFPIDHASATVHLPSAVPADSVKISGFTGAQGSRLTYLTTTVEDGAFLFTTTRPLPGHEGLTILLQFPKDYFAELTFSQKLEYFFRDNADALLLCTGLLVIALYYLIAWSAVGKDSAPGVIMPLYEPPANLSPAAMRYLVHMGFDNKTFAAAVLDMAVRGYLRIAEKDGSYTLTLTGQDGRRLSPDEKQIAGELFDGRSEIWLHQENHTVIQAALVAIKKWLKTAEYKVYFLTNSQYLIFPVLLSVAIIVAYLVAQRTPQIAVGAFMGLWLTGWTIGTAGLLTGSVSAWRGALHSPSPAGGTGKALFLTLFSIPFVAFEIFGFFMLLKFTSYFLVLFLIAACVLHLLFHCLLKAPTVAGRRLLDQVEGFKMFLSAVDGDRLNRVMPPQQTPAIFEKFLPYALALDVEQHWAAKFSGVLAAAGTAPGSSTVSYTPSFYSGAAFGSFAGTGFASSFSSSFTSAISSSATAPGSGSGGGGSGGGSGGGGGGGGGGGW